MQNDSTISSYALEKYFKEIAYEMNKQNSIAILDRLLQQNSISVEEYIEDLRYMLKH